MGAINRYTWASLAACLLTIGNLQAEPFDAATFTQTITEGQAMWQVPGIAVAVIEDGEMVFQQGFGQATLNGSNVDEHTLFANASTTKAMVAAGILLLADEGKLELDDLVIEHLPEVHFPAGALTQQVSIRDLLAHRTGLPSTDFWTFRQLTPLAEQVRKLRLVDPAAAPRSRHIYQNTMYELAGMIIHRLSGMPWYEFLEDRLWNPIGMHETVGMRGQIPPNKRHVDAHAEVDGSVRRVPFDLPAEREDAAGSAWSSVHDMALWAQFLLDDGVTAAGERLLSEESIAAMFEPQNLVAEDDYYPSAKLTRPNWRSYGLGWYQQDFQGRKIDYHTGSLDGLVAIIGLDRDNLRAVVVLQNMDSSELRHALLWYVMDTRPADERLNWNEAVFDLYQERAREREERWNEVAAARIADSTPSLALDAYLGAYRSEILGDVFLERRRGGLVLRTGMYEYEVSHWHLDTFLVDYLVWSYPGFAHFTIDEKGRVAGMDAFGHSFEKLPEDE